MPAKKSQEGRYSAEAAAVEVRRAMSTRPGPDGQLVSQKMLAGFLGISEGQLSRKIRMSDGKSEFNINELGMLADFFRAPLGWPFLPWEVGEKAFRG
jgi:hypothetical protein